MKGIWIFAALLMAAGAAVAQQSGISPDGKYVYVTEDKTPDHSGSTLVVQSADGRWKREAKGAYSPAFTADSRHVLYLTGDTLVIQRTGADAREVIAGVSSYQLQAVGRHQWLGILDGANRLRLRTVQSGGSAYAFDGISRFAIDGRGRCLLFGKHGDRNALRLVSLADGSERTLWSGTGEWRYHTADPGGNRLAFLLADSAGASLWQYTHGEAQAVCLAKAGMAAFGDELVVSSDAIIRDAHGRAAPLVYSPGGSKLLFYAQEKEAEKAPTDGVDIWSYTDSKPMDWQVRDAAVPLKTAFVADAATGTLLRLEQGANEKLSGLYLGMQVSDLQVSDSHAVVLAFTGDAFTYFSTQGILMDGYSVLHHGVPWLVSLRDGSRTRIRERLDTDGPQIGFPYFRLAPGGGHVLYFEGSDYHAYDIATGQHRNLTQALDAAFAGGNEYATYGCLERTEVFGWAEGDVLIHDTHADLWRVDLSGNRAAVCVTGGFFRRMFGSPDSIHIAGLAPVAAGRSGTSDGRGSLVCRAFADRHHSDGYYHIRLDGSAEPVALIPVGTPHLVSTFQQSERGDLFLLQREAAVEPHHWVATRDFRDYSRVTGSAPDLRPPGIDKEVIRWTMHDGRRSQGILHKPKDFDPERKYPVMLIYYEKRMEWHNTYLPYDVGTWVDHGYLVFCPDIYYTIGQVGKSAVNAVVSAGEYLAGLPYVDGSRMGIYGGSFGGLQTNYLVTQTGLFAAAASLAGYSDLVANKGHRDTGSRGHEGYRGLGQNRQGATLWERPDIYLANSPLFFADRVETPLLLVHGDADNNIPVEQGVAFFRALRTLGKRAWLLQYNGEGHMAVTSIGVGYAGQGDRNTRILQFFNHYLKGAPAPKWMLEGVPARMKGKETGLELDTTGRTPGPGLRWLDDYRRSPAQQELLKRRTRVTAEGRIEEVD